MHLVHGLVRSEREEEPVQCHSRGAPGKCTQTSANGGFLLKMVFAGTMVLSNIPSSKRKP